MNWFARFLGLESRAEVGAAVEKEAYAESDNRGNRHDSAQKAIGYWMVERRQAQRQDPFLMFEFKNADSARKALLGVPCIKVAKDTGKLICTKMLIFGFYKTDESHWEAVLCGDELTHDLWEQAKKSFAENGGTLKTEKEPEKKATPTKSAKVEAVKFVRKDQRPTPMGGMGTDEIYKAPNAASAQAFLQTKAVSQMFYSIVVETPEGNYVKDVNGTYKE